MTITSATLAEQALAHAERSIGPDADPLLLEFYARDFVWDRWRNAAGIPVCAAKAALRHIHEALARPRCEAFPLARRCGDIEPVRADVEHPADFVLRAVGLPGIENEALLLG